jgi:DNA-binding beta-propeller fold protein YncE
LLNFKLEKTLFSKGQRFFMRLFLVFSISLSFFSCKKSVVDATVSINQGTALVINGGENSISLIDIKTLADKGKIYLKNPGNTFAHHIYFTKDFSKISIALPEFDFSNSHDLLHNTKVLGHIMVLKTSDVSVSSKFPVSFANHNAIFSIDNKEIWTSLVSHSGKIQVFDANSQELIKEIPVGPDPSEVIFAKNGELALVACGETSFLTIIDTKSKSIIKELKIDPFPTNVWPGWADDIVFVENSNNKSLNIIDLNKFKVVDFIDFSFKPGFSIFNKSSNELWICSKGQNQVFVYEKKEGSWRLKNTILTENDPHQIAFINSNTQAIVINQLSNSAQVFDVVSKKEIKKLNTGLKPNGIAVWE